MNANVQVSNVIKYNCNAATIDKHSAASDRCIYWIFIFITKYDNNNKQLNRDMKKKKRSKSGSWRPCQLLIYYVFSSGDIGKLQLLWIYRKNKKKTVDKIRRNENFRINIIMIHCIKPFHCQWFTISFYP